MNNCPQTGLLKYSFFKKLKNVCWLEVQTMGSHDTNDGTKYVC